MPVLSARQIAGYAFQAGLRGEALVTAVAVALAESSGRTDVVSATNDVGLWQINLAAHPQYGRAWLTNPANNARAMMEISGRGTDWTPWVAYNHGRHRQYLPAARAAAAQVAGAGVDPNKPDLDLAPRPPDPGDILPSTPGGLDSPGDFIDRFTSIIEALGALAAALLDPNTWRRLGLILAGGLLLFAGAAYLRREIGSGTLTGDLRRAAGTVGKIKTAAA